MVFRVLGVFFAWSWFIWAFVFVLCLVDAIAKAVQEAADGQDHKSKTSALWAALSFAIILGGLTSLFFMA